MNAVKTLPITLEDIKLTEHILGPDIDALKGKEPLRERQQEASLHL
jgi:hypothetical protein